MAEAEEAQKKAKEEERTWREAENSLSGCQEEKEGGSIGGSVQAARAAFTVQSCCVNCLGGGCLEGVGGRW